MSLYCDPGEVLYELRLLGYRNISEKQLKEFIKDLKKLIKHDQKKIHSNEEESLVKPADSSYDSSYSSSSEISCVRLNSQVTSGHSSKFGETDFSSDLLSSCSSDSIDLPRHPKTSQKAVTKPMHTRSLNSKFIEEKKPKSFIKSWKLNQPPGVIKSDPVTLYHWYQEHWNKQKVPGEEPHKKLRWSVREKMLGDDPSPRPMSQASGRSSRNIRK
ncbi:centriolar and ciliogenesis-associated protein HYLS1 [Hetaerina americana]|uniref:centriolar and ciliogenesis-associated protein HYLS1 n=1 Tax=Hetaerina americana TaxID=62018 RepID=UPI003A7F4E72